MEYLNNNQNDILKYKSFVNSNSVGNSLYHKDIELFEQEQYKYCSYSDFLSNFIEWLDANMKLTHEYSKYLEKLINNLYRYERLPAYMYCTYYLMIDFYLCKSKYNENMISQNFTSFESNNFKKKSNVALDYIQNLNCSIWMHSKGRICMRLSHDIEHKEYTISQANMILANISETSVEIIKSPKQNNEDDGNYYILISDLIMIQDEVFDTTQNKEFFEVNGVWYRNMFKPSTLLQLNQQPKKVPYSIFNLIAHLVNYDVDRLFVFLNWLATFFQTLKKSQVAILFKGKQGAGKGTLFKIIEELFGKIYCKQINGDSLKSNYLGAFLENTLFLNFDEISYKTIGKGSFNSLLKAIITNEEVTAEKKGINMAKPTEVFAQTILFSNVENPVEIESSDRRFTVFTTSDNIKNTNYFGHGSFENFEYAMMEQIEDFAMYLKLYNTDINQANSVYETKEKDLMINRTENNLKWFVDAILYNDWEYFRPLQNINIALYNLFMKGLTKGRVYQKHLILVYLALYPQDTYVQSANSLIKNIEKIAPDIFGNHNLHKSNGDKYYSLFLEEYPEKYSR